MNRRNFLSSLLAVPVVVKVIAYDSGVKTKVEPVTRGTQDYWGKDTDLDGWGAEDTNHHLDAYSYTFPHRGWSED